MFLHRRRSSALAVLAVVLMLLAACGDDDGTGTAAGSSATNGDTDDGDQNPDGDGRQTTTTARATTTTEPVAPSGAECVVGTWIADNAATLETMAAMTPADVPITMESVTGTVRIELRADGTAVTTYDDWTLVAAMTDPVGSTTIVRTGVDSSTYTAGDDGSFSMTEVESNSTVDVTASVGGQTFAMPEVDGVQTDLIGGAGTYTCDGDRFSVEVEGGRAYMDRSG